MSYQVGDNSVRIYFEVPASAKKDASPSGRQKLLFVIDNSGSMSGGTYNQVKSAVEYIRTNANVSTDVDYILYNTTASFVTAEQILKSSATGSTSFEEALKLVQKYAIDQRFQCSMAVVFMTDGEDTASRNLETTIKEFSSYVSRSAHKLVLHVLGFTASHSKAFLDRLRNLGHSEGMYRYADSKELDLKFSEMFDFCDISRTVKTTIGTTTLDLDAEIKQLNETDKVVVIDVILPKKQFGGLFDSQGEVCLMVDDEPVILHAQAQDVFFKLKEIEGLIENVTERTVLDEAQRQLSAIVPNKVPKHQRVAAWELRSQIQEQLDKFHQAFADTSRGNLSGNHVAASLQSMRYDFKCNKARRQRCMNQRATRNEASLQDITNKLAALTFDKSLFDSMEYICPLSGDYISDVMTGSVNDFMVFSLRVTRPEHAIDAPSQVKINDILVGTYSNEAFQNAMKFALSKFATPELAHGGFSDSLGDSVGYFKGPDGKSMNACLPLFINEDHWKRVEVQLEPILAYFFTLDPLGFKGDQYLALFALYGSMLLLRSHGDFKSEWADWVIDQMKMTCKRVLPKALKYLAEGRYASGKIKTDLLDEFIKGPAGRTKEIIQNLLTIVGWADVQDRQNDPKFRLAFVEEVWRRGFSSVYKTQPREVVLELLEKLIYGPATDAGPTEEAPEDGKVQTNKAKDKEYAEWAEYKCGLLSKSRMEACKKLWGDAGPQDEGLLSDSEGFGYVPRPLIKFEDHEEYLIERLKRLDDKINKGNTIMSGFTEGMSLGTGLDWKTRWVMTIQALNFCTNDLMNSGVSSGMYKNTPEFKEDMQAIVAPIQEHLERSRRENWAATVREKNSLTLARRMIATNNIWSFAGRLMKAAPTRGGTVWDHFVNLLSEATAANEVVPLAEEKLAIVLTGKIPTKDANDNIVKHVVNAHGESWIHCTKDMARKFKALVGDEAFSRIEVTMYGHWGWVYRESDLPNRHKHCNSNPNPLLSSGFSGFNV